MKLATRSDGVIKLALNDAGWIEEDVLAAGHLRQGKAMSMLSMVLGYGLFELLRPKRSKQLPRHFTLAVTPTEVIAFRSTGGGDRSDGSGPYMLTISEEPVAHFPREAVSLSDLPEGEKSQGGTLTVNGESFPVCRPNMSGDPNTDELIAVLSGGA